MMMIRSYKQSSQMVNKLMISSNTHRFLQLRASIRTAHADRYNEPPPMNPQYTQETNEEYEERLLQIKKIAHEHKMKERETFNRRAEQDLFEEDDEEDEDPKSKHVRRNKDAHPFFLSPNHPNFLVYRKIVILAGVFAFGMSLFLYHKFKNENAKIAAANRSSGGSGGSGTESGDDLGARTGRGISIETSVEEQKKALEQLHADILQMEQVIVSELKLTKKEARDVKKEIRQEAVRRVKERRESSI